MVDGINAGFFSPHRALTVTFDRHQAGNNNPQDSRGVRRWPGEERGARASQRTLDSLIYGG